MRKSGVLESNIEISLLKVSSKVVCTCVSVCDGKRGIELESESESE